MCIIFACYGGRPSDALLELAAVRNPDGAGIAWVEKKKVKWRKGMDDIKEVQALVKEKPFPFMVHFRVATVGGPLAVLTHPFPITPNVSLDLEGEADEVLMHNGHFTDWNKELKYGIYLSNSKCPGGPWSDSRALAFLVQRYGHNMIPLLLNGDRVICLSAKGAKPDFFVYGTTWVPKKAEGFIQSAELDVTSIRITDRRTTHRPQLPKATEEEEVIPPRIPASPFSTPRQAGLTARVIPPGERNTTSAAQFPASGTAYSEAEIALVLSELRLERAGGH